MMTLPTERSLSADSFTRIQRNGALKPVLVFRQTEAAQVLNSTVLDPRADDEWDRAITRHPEATIFHSSAWARVLCDTYGHRPFYLRLTNAGETAALLPVMEVASAITGRRGVCLPFSDSCVALDFSKGSTESLLSAVRPIARARGWKYVELRGNTGDDAGASPSYYAHRVDLAKPTDDLFAGCESAFRRGVRKAERSGLSVRLGSDLNAVREFYALHSRTRRRHGVPPQPFSFFRNIFINIVARNLGFVVLAMRDATPIAGAMFFHFNGRGVFKFGASDERHQELRASNLVMWTGMKECAGRGLTTLHLGRTDLHQEGLRRFKSSLGAKEEGLSYVRFDPAANCSSIHLSGAPPSVATALFRKLPLTINRLAGTMLYPHLH